MRPVIQTGYQVALSFKVKYAPGVDGEGGGAGNARE